MPETNDIPPGEQEEKSSKSRPEEDLAPSKRVTDANDKRPGARFFMDYMREQNSDDREYLEEFATNIPVPDGWNVELHYDDLHPAVWMRRDKYVILVYMIAGAMSVMLGELRQPVKVAKPHWSTMMPGMADDRVDAGAKKEDEKADYTMVFPLAKTLQVNITKDGEKVSKFEKEDASAVAKVLEELIGDCVGWLDMVILKGHKLAGESKDAQKDDKVSTE